MALTTLGCDLHNSCIHFAHLHFISCLFAQSNHSSALTQSQDLEIHKIQRFSRTFGSTSPVSQCRVLTAIRSTFQHRQRMLWQHKLGPWYSFKIAHTNFHILCYVVISHLIQQPYNSCKISLSTQKYSLAYNLFKLIDQMNASSQNISLISFVFFL